MDLHLALRNILKEKGADFIHDERIINALDDFGAFNYHSSMRNVFRILFKDGIINKIVREAHLQNKYNKINDDIARDYAFPLQIIEYLMQSILFGIGYEDNFKFECLAHNSSQEGFPQFPSKSVKPKNHLKFCGISFENPPYEFERLLYKKGFEDNPIFDAKDTIWHYIGDFCDMECVWLDMHVYNNIVTSIALKWIPGLDDDTEDDSDGLLEFMHKTDIYSKAVELVDSLCSKYGNCWVREKKGDMFIDRLTDKYNESFSIYEWKVEGGNIH